MPRHRAGGKIAASHSTIIDAAAIVIDTAQKLPEVTKIVLSIIESMASRKVRLNFSPVTAGWKIVVHGGTCLQTLYVYTSDPVSTRSSLYRAFQSG